MRSLLPLLASLALFAADAPPALAPTKADVPYAGTTELRQTLNVYAPATKPAKAAPVIFWIHGGGWRGGEKTSVQLKPKFFTDLGYVFVSTNHRYVTAVPMNEIFADVAKSLRWTHDHAAEFGGDPNRIVIMGHSSGAQLAAYMAIDERPLKAEGLSLSMFKGCVPVDADTFDIPAVIELATANRTALGEPGKAGGALAGADDGLGALLGGKARHANPVTVEVALREVHVLVHHVLDQAHAVPIRHPVDRSTGCPRADLRHAQEVVGRVAQAV